MPTKSGTCLYFFMCFDLSDDNFLFIPVHNVEPDYTREGGSIPVVLTLAETTGKDCVLLPMGRSDDGAHSQNEKLNITNFQAGVSLGIVKGIFAPDNTMFF